MSTITLPTLTSLTPSALSTLLLSSPSWPSQPSPTIAVIDVRDSDHVGGHILHHIWTPSSTLDYKIPELVRTLKDKEKVVFHCALSQQRGPGAALRYARERERMGLKVGKGIGGEGEGEGEKGQEVCVLEGGFVEWQEA
jgi:rhodanese-related sulfurtransferase